MLPTGPEDTNSSLHRKSHFHSKEVSPVLEPLLQDSPSPVTMETFSHSEKVSSPISNSSTKI